MITEQQSCAYDIRDTFFNAVVADATFTGFTTRKNRMLPVQPNLIPYLGVYLVDETMLPDGDANAGCIRFSHTARIGFSVIVQNSDQDAAAAAVDNAFLRIMSILFTDQHIMNVLHNTNPENVGIESITRGVRKHVYGATGVNNETPFMELQYDVSCFYRTEWYPDITDTLDEIDVTVLPNNDPNANSFEIIYDFTSSKEGDQNGQPADESGDSRPTIEGARSAKDRKPEAARYSGHSQK